LAFTANLFNKFPGISVDQYDDTQKKALEEANRRMKQQYELEDAERSKRWLLEEQERQKRWAAEDEARKQELLKQQQLTLQQQQLLQQQADQLKQQEAEQLKRQQEEQLRLQQIQQQQQFEQLQLQQQTELLKRQQEEERRKMMTIPTATPVQQQFQTIQKTTIIPSPTMTTVTTQYGISCWCCRRTFESIPGMLQVPCPYCRSLNRPSGPSYTTTVVRKM